MLTNDPANDNNRPATDYLDGFIDESQAADFLCQSVRTIQKWRETGFGPKFYKSGRSVRYRRRELLEWAEARRYGKPPHSFPHIATYPSGRACRARGGSCNTPLHEYESEGQRKWKQRSCIQASVG